MLVRLLLQQKAPMRPGTVYYSDTYGLEDRLEILQIISAYDLAGDAYPSGGTGTESGRRRTESITAKKFIDFLITDDAKDYFSGNTTLIQM